MDTGPKERIIHLDGKMQIVGFITQTLLQCLERLLSYIFTVLMRIVTSL